MHGFTVGLHRSWERRAEDRHSKSQNENGCGQVTINRWITKGVCLTMLLIIYEQKHIDEKIIVILSFNSQQMPYCTTYTSNCNLRNPDTWSGRFMGLFTTSWPKWKPKTWSGFATPEKGPTSFRTPHEPNWVFGMLVWVLNGSGNAYLSVGVFEGAK